MIKDKKKILIIINSELYLRNYIQNNIFKELNKKYKLFYLSNKNIQKKKIFNNLKNFLGYFSYSKKSEIQHTRNFNVTMWRYRKLSKSFEYRIKWFSEINLFEMNKFNFRIFRKKILRIYQVLKFRLFIQLFGSRIIFLLYKFFFIDILKVNRELEKKILLLKPDLVILPTQSQTPCDNDVAKICSKNKITTLYLVDNWDNLSDKSKILFSPDYLAVWGEQTKKHAINIQSHDKNKIFKIGTPRFESYFLKRNQKLKRIFNFRYILFLGTALEFDEYRILKKINEILDCKPFNKKIKLVYRPHPWRMSDKIFSFDKCSNIVLDPQMKKNYFSKNSKKMNLSFQPNLSYYPSLIKNSEFILGGLTSMIIESLIFYKKYIITALPEDKFNNQFNSLNYHHHFRELGKVKNLKICTNIEKLKKYMISVYNLKSDKNKKRTDFERNFFLFKNSNSYSLNILKIVNKII